MSNDEVYECCEWPEVICNQNNWGNKYCYWHIKVLKRLADRTLVEWE